MNSNIYVGNLPYRTTEEDLKAHFEPYGTVVRVKIVSDKETNRSKGYGFVEMASDEEAQAAVDGLNSQQYGGRTLKVDFAKPREEKSNAPAAAEVAEETAE